MPNKKTAKPRSSFFKTTKRLVLLQSCLKIVKLAVLMLEALTKLSDSISKLWNSF